MCVGEEGWELRKRGKWLELFVLPMLKTRLELDFKRKDFLAVVTEKSR